MNKNLLKRSLPSFCTSNFDVLKAVLIFAKYHNLPVLIESTSNQVNQYGGYSGLNPFQFVKKLKNLAKLIKLKKNSMIIGGDHLGPLPWKNLSSVKALENSKILIKDCLKAKYNKIHIDTAVICQDEAKIDRHIIIKRCDEILNFFSKKYFKNIFLVIGTEVPIAGGGHVLKSSPTKFVSIKEEIDLYSTILEKNKKFALVIEPGIGFGHLKVIQAKLKNFNKSLNFSKKNNFYYEAHSTDYQKIQSLKKLVKNNFKFLKVGPELTYFLSKVIFKMEKIENETYSKKISNIKNILDREMKKKPKYWIGHYKGSPKNLRILKFNSYLDRLRYYWDNKQVLNAKKKLFRNINLINEKKFVKYFKFNKKSDLKLKNKFKLNNSEFIIFKTIEKVLIKYYIACGFKLKKEY